MMVLLLYIQNQDKQKMTKKKSNQISRKKNPNPATTQNNPKNPSKTTKKFATHHNFFLQVMNKILEKNKTSKRKRNNVFVFDPEVPKKKTTTKLQNPGNTKSKLTRKTKILQKNPMKYTHKKVELKKKKSSEKKLLLPFSFFAVQQLVKLT